MYGLGTNSAMEVFDDYTVRISLLHLPLFNGNKLELKTLAIFGVPVPFVHQTCFSM